MKNFLYRKIKIVYAAVNRIYCNYQRKKFIHPLRCIIDKLAESGPVSIISTNCFAGRIMQDLKMAYTSPTVGLYFMYPDYIEFLKHLKFYLTEAELSFVNQSKYELGNRRHQQHDFQYPIGVLDNKVEIHFLHYHSEQEAKEKWYRRISRVNFNNLLIIGMQQNLCSEKDIFEFDSLPFKNKIMFSTNQFSLKSNEYIDEMKGKESVGDPYKKGHIFYKHFIDHFSK